MNQFADGRVVRSPRGLLARSADAAVRMLPAGVLSMSVMLSTGLVESEASGQDDVASLPTAKAVASLAELAGEWTLDLSSVAPGVTSQQTVTWDAATATLEVVWETADRNGLTLAEGRGRIAWDDIAGAVINTYAGRDGDRRFSGSATLTAVDGPVSDWRGHETRGAGGSVNFEVTYDLRDPDVFVVDFIPTCIDGLESLMPVRFSWNRFDRLRQALPNADELTGEWELVSGGRPELPNGTTMSVSRGAGGRSLVFLTMEPGRFVDGDLVPGAIMGVEQIWIDPETGELLDRYLSMDGEVLTSRPRLDVIGDDDATVIQASWVGGERSSSDRNGFITWTWVTGNQLHVVFIDEPMTDTPQETLWMRR